MPDRNAQLENAMVRRGHSFTSLAAAVGHDRKTVERWVVHGRVPRRAARVAVAHELDLPEGLLWSSVQHVTSDGDADLVAVYQTRKAVPAAAISAHAAAATATISVLAYAGTWLWDGVPGFTDELVSAVQRGVRVRVLLGDPDGVSIAARGVEEGIGERAMRGRCEVALAAVRKLRSTFPECVRAHDTTLYATILCFDADLYVNWHVYGVAAGDAPVFHLRSRDDGSGIAGTVLNSFEAVWAQAQPVVG